MNRNGSLFVAVLLTIFLSSCLKKKEAFPLSDVARAPDHLNEDRLRFGGIPQLSLMGVYKWRGATGPGNKPGVGKRHHFRYVVPITNEAWDSSKPVTLWLSFSTVKEHVNPEIGRLRQAMSKGEIEAKTVDYPGRTTGVLRGVSAWQNAVADACAKHGLKTDPRAPIVAWK